MLWLLLKRWIWRRKARDPLLQRLLRQSLSFTRLPFAQQRFLVIDLETTALNPQQGEIVSIGWVVIENGRILLNQARMFQLAPVRGVGQSAVFHQLTDSQLEAGEDFSAVAPQLLAAAANSTLVFHNATLDMGFLNHYLHQQYGAPLLAPVMDTLQLEYRRRLRRNHSLQPGELRLGACRHRYGLPELAAHDALTDALATAELFLAIHSEQFSRKLDQAVA